MQGAPDQLDQMREENARLRAANDELQRLRTVVDSVTQHAIITHDAHGRIESWNTGAEQMFGWTADEATGQPSALIFTPEDRAEDVPQKERDEARHSGRAPDERWHLRKDGSRIFVSGVLSPIGDPITGYVKVARDLTERKQWEEELKRAHGELEARVAERTEQLSALLSRIITVQEEERRRIARDLHDDLGQKMTALHLQLEALRHKPDDYAAWERRFRDVQAFAVQIDRDLDFFTWELKPAALYDLGLPQALRDYVEMWSRNFNTPAELEFVNLQATRFSRDVEINLYRISQEALNNVYKHARAKSVAVALQQRDGQLVLTIEDDGIGFDPEDRAKRRPTSIGLVGMHERAAIVGGTLEIESSSGQGTTVIAAVPAQPVH